MITVAHDILDTARSVYMNDPNASQYSDAVLLPHLKTAYGFLETELESNGVQCKNEEVIATIPANTDEYYPLPPDLVIPRAILERRPGSSDEFSPMLYKNNIPQITPGSYLYYWTYRLDRIFFLQATQDREIKLLYQKAFPAVNTADAVLFGKAEHYLAAKVAALAHMFITQSITLAQVAESIAKNELDEIVNMQIRLMQTEVIRRKPYVPQRSS